MNIILAGMPGSGKTTVARVFKERGKTVLDTDEEIVKKYGDISEIFARFGEEHFRDIESQTVRETALIQGAVIATGGGCLLRAENVNCFKKSGKIVYLRANLETLLTRLEGDETRPLLQGDRRAKLQKLFSDRAPVYERSADIIVDVDGLTPKEVANKILENVK